jgi:hypothetical protein
MVAAINAAAQAKARGLVTLRDLCEEMGADARAGRLLLRQEGVPKNEGAYAWPAHELDRVREVLRALCPPVNVGNLVA